MSTPTPIPTKFKVYYDDQLMNVVDRIASNLKQFGLDIISNDEETDGYVEYEIIKLDTTPIIETLEVATLLQVTDAKILNSDKRNGITGGTYITFLSKDTIAKDTYVDVTINNRTHHFQVRDIVIQGELLQIDAVETGYWARKIDRKDGFDLRTMLGLPVTVVTDEEKKKQIYTESCWC